MSKQKRETLEGHYHVVFVYLKALVTNACLIPLFLTNINARFILFFKSECSGSATINTIKS